MCKQSLTPTLRRIESLFDALNEKYFDNELPKCVMSIGKKEGCYGYFTAYKPWRDVEHDENRFCEISITAGYLDRPVLDMITTILHEMVHEYNFIHEVQDTSRGGTYHNAEYKKAAEAHGLIVEKSAKYGWSTTHPSEDLTEWVKAKRFKENTLVHDTPTAKKKTKKKSNSRKYVCPCCGAIIRATREVNVICGDCMETMVLDA
jgi:hypothetical protein